MEGPSGLDSLAEAAATDPGNLDYRTLCRCLAAEDYDISNRAEEIREEAIQQISAPEEVFESLWTLTVYEEDPVRRAAVETLHRVVRVWPRELTPRVATGLKDPDARRRAAAADNLGRLPSGTVKPHVSALVGCLDDDDPRVGALALNALSRPSEDFPAVLVPYLDAIEPFLEDRWIPEDGDGMQLIYSKTNHDSNEDAGEPTGERLTNRVPRPFGDALSLLAHVSIGSPKASLGLLHVLLRSLRTCPPDTSGQFSKC